MIRIIMCSGADSSQEMLDTYDMKFVPLTVILDEKEYLDGIEITLPELHEYMEAGNFPKTSQINPELAIEALEESAKAGEDVIFITVFSQLSGTYQVAHNAMNIVKEKYPDFKCEVIDSKSGAGGETILFLTGMEMIKRDYDYESVVKQLRQSASQLLTYLAVEDLNWLAKGGRLPKSVGKIGSMLKVKPLLSLDDNGIVKKGLIRGSDRVYMKMVDEVLAEIEQYDDQYIAISHVAQVDTANKMKERVLETSPNAVVEIFEISPVIASHIGIGGIGMFALKEKPEHFYPISL